MCRDYVTPRFLIHLPRGRRNELAFTEVKATLFCFFLLFVPIMLNYQMILSTWTEGLGKCTLLISSPSRNSPAAAISSSLPAFSLLTSFMDLSLQFIRAARITWELQSFSYKTGTTSRKIMWMVIKLSILLKLGQMFNPASLQDIQWHHVDSQIHFRKRDQLLSQHSEPQGWVPRHSALLSSPGITFIKKPSFIQRDLVIYIFLICFAKLRSQNFAYKPCGSSNH